MMMALNKKNQGITKVVTVNRDRNINVCIRYVIQQILYSKLKM